MAQVKVMYLGNVYNATGKQMEYFELKDTVTVRRLLFALVEQYGNQFKLAVMNSSSTVDNLLLRVMVGVNGRDINALKGLDTELKDGDSLVFMVPAEGGCTKVTWFSRHFSFLRKLTLSATTCLVKQFAVNRFSFAREMFLKWAFLKRYRP